MDQSVVERGQLRLRRDGPRQLPREHRQQRQPDRRVDEPLHHLVLVLRLLFGGRHDDQQAGHDAELAAAVAGPEVDYTVRLPGEGAEAEVFFSDLSHEYVTINADYTT